MGAKNHSDLLAVNFKSFLLKVGFKDTLSATQREADVVAKLLAFSGEFTSCCHIITSTYFFTIYTILPFYGVYVKVKLSLLDLCRKAQYAEQQI